MRWLVLVVSLAACDRMFGVMTTTEVDARKFDVAIDAPFSCPAFGTPLQFSTLIHEIIVQDCSNYSISSDANLALAICHNPDDTAAVDVGPIDQPLAPAVGLPDSNMLLTWAEISPEGDLVSVMYNEIPQLYRPNADGSWAYVADLPTGDAVLTTFSRGPVRHVMAVHGGPILVEWTFDGTTWTQLATTFDSAATTIAAWLSPDGLHLITTDSKSLHQYADRAAIDDPFTARGALPSLPSVGDLFVTADCSRAYFSAVGTIFYAQQ